MRRNILIMTSLLGAALAVPAFARTAKTAGNAKLKQVATMAVPAPGKKLNVFDISWVDQGTQRYLLSDRTNAAVDVFNARTDKYIGGVHGFVGVKKNANGKTDYPLSGPNGVLSYDGVVWAGDGDSTAREASLRTLKIIHSVSTGGKNRCDELGYDPVNHVLACGNGDDEPPFLTLISTISHKVIAKLPFPNATDGLEAPTYNPADGLFYESVPELDHNPKMNGVAVITPKGKLLKILPVANCNPAGIVFGPNQNFLLGCGADGKDGMAPIAVIMNAKTGKLVATVPGVGGVDEVAYSAKNQQYYSAGADMNTLFVIDALTNKLVQKIPTGGHAHSVAASDVTGKVFVPEGADGGCGCVRVFAPEM